MIVGTGIDMIEVERVRAVLERHPKRFTQRVFTPDEVKYCQSKPNAAERFAARFAAKEAALKAIGTGWRQGVAWKEIEVGREPGGRPTIRFSGRVAEIAWQMGATRASLSLSHTEQFAIAQVILEKD